MRVFALNYYIFTVNYYIFTVNYCAALLVI